DRPFLWGSKRTGPDLARIGLLKPSASWHYRHLENPQSTSQGSNMPPYPWLVRDTLDLDDLPAKLRVLSGAPMMTPYDQPTIANAAGLAKAQAATIAAEIRRDLPSLDDPALEQRE